MTDESKAVVFKVIACFCGVVGWFIIMWAVFMAFGDCYNANVMHPTDVKHKTPRLELSSPGGVTMQITCFKDAVKEWKYTGTGVRYLQDSTSVRVWVNDEERYSCSGLCVCYVDTVGVVK